MPFSWPDWLFGIADDKWREPMKLVKSLAILAAVIVLGIIVYFKVYKVEERNKAKAAQESKLIRFNLDNIKEFTLARPDSSEIGRASCRERVLRLV